MTNMMGDFIMQLGTFSNPAGLGAANVNQQVRIKSINLKYIFS